eukprot:CAMPEP_0198137610 /NCGR_PEP_ID=MMETSP1443-20131203/1086_1 /TAXON_ID=186043 /ORGANISM="Entomoneis sp., Strain CCMP2396" /LENGTH=546 /DNA_ID=CAMNT_0043799103 /DNA_START=33 /DNA_END=1673 /DNA_ORIENTATION=+
MNIKSEKVGDHAALSESLLSNEQQGGSSVEEQVVFVDEREVMFDDDEQQNFGGSGGGRAEVVVTSAGERQPHHWRDAWAAVLFLSHQVAIFYLAFVWGVPALNYSYTEEGDYSNNDDDNGGDSGTGGNNTDGSYNDPGRFLDEVLTEEVHLSGLLLLCFLSSIGALLLGAAAISVMIRFAEKTIQFSMFFAIFCNGLVVVSFALEKQWVGFGLSSVFLVWLIVYTQAVWSRVPFAASNLLVALTAVQTNGGLILVSLASTIAVSVWTLIWILALVGVYMRNAECYEGTCETHTNGFFFLLLLLSYYWTSEVFKNVMHVTTAGTVGTWWFAPDDACTYCSPAITDSLRRATTYSLGSVCFGSLLTALLQLLHQICHDLRRRGRGNAILLCVVEAVLAVLESLVSYFNKWAYIYIGLYGYDYITSGGKVVALFRQRGWSAIINDHLVTRALSLVSLVIGALTGCMGMALASVTSWVSDFGDAALVLAFFVPFICGLASSMILLSVVASAVDTVIVSFAESPLEMERNHPGLYTQMVRAWRQAFPEEFR